MNTHKGVGEGDAGLPPVFPKNVFPTDAKERKQRPVFTGCLKYFPTTFRAIARLNGGGLYSAVVARYPRALAAISHCSWMGNQQHHPDKPLHWDMAKSSDEEDALIRHLIEGEMVQVAWRACANAERKAGRRSDAEHWVCPEPSVDALVDQLLDGAPVYAAKIALELLETHLATA